MLVAELAAQCAPEEVAEALRELYPEYQFSAQGVAAWQVELALEQPTERDLEVVAYLRPDFPEGDRKAYPTVDGRTAQGDIVAMDLSSWSDWHSLAVVDETGLGLAPAQLAALVYYEMTWHGGQEDVRAVRQELERRIAQLDADIASGNTKGWMTIDEFMQRWCDDADSGEPDPPGVIN